LFKARGYHSTTMDDIAEKAESAGEPFLNYFRIRKPYYSLGTRDRDQRISSQIDIYLEHPANRLAGFPFHVHQNERNHAGIPGCNPGSGKRSSKVFPSGHIGLGEGGTPRGLYTSCPLCPIRQARGEIRSDLPNREHCELPGCLADVTYVPDDGFHPWRKISPWKLSQLLTFLERGL